MICVASGADSRNHIMDSNLPKSSLAVKSALDFAASEEMDVVQTSDYHSESSSLAAQQNFWLDHVPTFEPLKLCLDDSSTEGDEDMFDDDAFTFGDEDFQTLMSHDCMKRMSIKSQMLLPCRHEQSVTAMSADIPTIPSHLPLHEEVEKANIKAAASIASLDSSSASGTSTVSSQQLGSAESLCCSYFYVPST